MSIRSYRNFSEKKLTSSIPRSTGRNNRGIITSGDRGGGHKQKYRFIDFRRSRLALSTQAPLIEFVGSVGETAKMNPVGTGSALSTIGGPANEAIVQRIEYDPNRNANIALISYLNGEKEVMPFLTTSLKEILGFPESPKNSPSTTPLLMLGCTLLCLFKFSLSLLELKVS